ncbi:MAG: hypothetical protein ACOX6E_06735 [Syntrophomonadaceae bacterium]|jgi:hypothetical protein
MPGDITASEIELLNAFQILTPAYKRELKDYNRYLLCKQYKREVVTSVFQNKLLHNLFHSLIHLIEKEEVNVEQIGKRIYQIKELYYSIFEQVHCKYCELVEDLDSNEMVTAFARNSFSSLDRAIKSNNQDLLRFEVLNFYQEYNRLAKNKDGRNVIAV